MNGTALRINRALITALSAALFGLAAISPAAQGSELKQTMNDMKRAYNGAMKSSSIDEFARYAALLQSSASAAGKVNYRSDPAIYQEGMKALQLDIDRLNQAVQAKDLNAAKDALRVINTTKKRYHDELG